MRKRHGRFNFAGSIHFITTVTRVRGKWFATDSICRALLELFEGYRAKHDIDCIGYILMPDHLHALLYQREEGNQVSKLMQDFKSVSSRKFRPQEYPEKHLWRDRYDDVLVPGPNAARTKLEYLHNNPVRRGIAERVQDYSWSSAGDWFGTENGIVTVAKLR